MSTQPDVANSQDETLSTATKEETEKSAARKPKPAKRKHKLNSSNADTTKTAIYENLRLSGVREKSKELRAERVTSSVCTDQTIISSTRTSTANKINELTSEKNEDNIRQNDILEVNKTSDDIKQERVGFRGREEPNKTTYSSTRPKPPKPSPRKRRRDIHSGKIEGNTPSESGAKTGILEYKEGARVTERTDSDSDNMKNTAFLKQNELAVYDVPPKPRRPLQRTKAIDESANDVLINLDGADGHEQDSGSPPAEEEKPTSDPVAFHCDMTLVEPLVVDKRYYEYLCRFRSEDIDPVKIVCDLDTKPTADGDSNSVELTVTKARAGTMAEWSQQLAAVCERLKQELVIEHVTVSDLDDVTKYRSEVEGRHRCVFFTRPGVLEVVCERRVVDEIRNITDSYKTKEPVAPPQLPAGYDLAGAFSVYVYKADIVKLAVDAMVVLTDERLQHESGAAKAIAEAAGYKLVKSCMDYVQKTDIQTSDVIKTTAGNLQCKVVLHAVQPIWPYFGDENAQNIYRLQLVQMFQNILLAAHKERCTSVALCPNNTEVSDVPSEVTAKAVKGALLNFSVKRNRTRFSEVHVVARSDEVLVSIVRELGSGGRLRAAGGRYVAVVPIDGAELRNILTGHQDNGKVIGSSGATPRRNVRRQRSNSLRRLLCAGSKQR